MTGQEKGDFLIQVTAWAGLTVYNIPCIYSSILLAHLCLLLAMGVSLVVLLSLCSVDLLVTFVISEFYSRLSAMVDCHTFHSINNFII